MAIRKGNDEKIVIIQEVTYNTALASYADVIPLNCTSCTITPNPTIIETGVKTNTNQSTVCETVMSRMDYDVVIEGSFNLEHTIFFEAYMGAVEVDGSIDFNNNDLLLTPYSYQILKMYPDAKREQISGAVLTTLVITKADGDILKYTATFKASGYLVESSVTLTGLPVYADITIPTCSWFTKCEFTTLTGVNNWTLTLTNEFADDNIAFANQESRQKEILYRNMGELSLNILYDTTAPYTPSSWVSTVDISDTITVENSTKYIGFAIYYQITNAPKTTPDRSVYLVDITGKLVKRGALDMFSVTIDDV